MSSRDEYLAIKMKLDYDPDKNEQTIILKQNMDNNMTGQAGWQVEDCQNRGKVKGVCRIKPCFHWAAAKLDWKKGDYYVELRQVLLGHVVNAYEWILTQTFWSDATNRVDTNREDLIKILSDDQDEVRGVMLEELKFEMIEQGHIPTKALERFEDFFSFLGSCWWCYLNPNCCSKTSLLLWALYKVMEAEVCNGPEGHNQRHRGLEVRDQVHEVVVQVITSDSETYFLWSAPQKV